MQEIKQACEVKTQTQQRLQLQQKTHWTVAGGGKRGKAAPVAPPPAEAKLIEIKIKKPSPGKLNVKDELGSTLKRKYHQLSHANKKIKELKDQGKTEKDCND